jgi:alkylated DNA repair dioxygenase AlkB
VNAQQTLSFGPDTNDATDTSAPGASAFHTRAPEKLELADAELLYFPRFYDAPRSAALLHALLAETPWRQDRLKFGGKDVLVPRLQAWYGERRYAYSGLRLEPLPWTPLLDAMRHEIGAACGLEFNSVLLNYYRDGNDSVAWHSDDERELGPDPRIASLSLGATRRFELKHRTRKPAKVNIALEDGSLLLMGSGVQQHWVHQLPKEAGVTAPRLNLTFRLIH